MNREQVGEQTTDVRRSHRSTGDGVGGPVASVPGGKNVESGSEDVNTLAVVGEVGSLVVQVGSTNGDGVFGSSGRVVAGVLVVVSSSDGKVKTRLDGLVDSIVEGLDFATTERHVGDGALVLGLSGSGELSSGFGGLGGGIFSSPSGNIISSDSTTLCLADSHNTGNDVTHASRSVASQNLDGNNLGSFGNTVLSASNGTSAVGSVTVSVLVDVVLGDGLSPRSSAFKLDVLDVDTSVHNVRSNTFTTIGVVDVLCERTEAELSSVGESSQTPWGAQFGDSALGGDDFGRGERVIDTMADLGGVHDLVSLNIGDLWGVSDRV